MKTQIFHEIFQVLFMLKGQIFLKHNFCLKLNPFKKLSENQHYEDA